MSVPEPEHFDSAEHYAAKIQQLISLFQSAKHAIVCTGAGISTSADVPDFRGAKGLMTRGVISLNENALDWTMPTLAHVAIVRLLESGLLKFVVTSNHDNFHRKSGVQDSQLAELFGNAYIEQCGICNKQFTRQTAVPHLGRTCETCGKGKLFKTGVRFGQATPEEPLKRAMEQGRKADLALVLGSSMTVSPFCEIPALAKQYVIVNLQETPYDKLSTLKINANIDDVMRDLMKGLQLNVGSYTYQQTFVVGTEYNEAKKTVSLYIDSGRTNELCTCIEKVVVKKLTNGIESTMSLNSKPRLGEVEVIRPRPAAASSSHVTPATTTTSSVDREVPLEVTVEFKEQYNAPPLKIEITAVEGKSSQQSHALKKIVNY